ncbi:MAG: hypothetical protein U0270_16540 [Labilithrix sp.]
MASIAGAVVACVGADPAPTGPADPARTNDSGGAGVDAAPPFDAGPFRCEDTPAFEASLSTLPPSPPAVPRNVIVTPDPNAHLLLVPADIADGGATLGVRTGALWLTGLLAGASGFRATFEYSAYVWSGPPGEGVALAWAAAVPPTGQDFGVCGSGVAGHAFALSTAGATPTLFAHSASGCPDRSSAPPLIGAKLLTSANTPSPWYRVDVTVAPSRVTYALVELGVGAATDAGPLGPGWQGSFERGGFDGEAITDVGLTARTGVGADNTAQRVRNLKIFRCTGR